MSAQEWRRIETAPKDRTSVLLHIRADLATYTKRDDLDRWSDVQFVGRHPGILEDGFDIGWSVAAPVGHGGFPDDWIDGWQPLPGPPLQGTDT